MSGPAHELRELANRLHKVGGILAQAGLDAGRSTDDIQADLTTLVAARDLLRKRAIEIEAVAAPRDPKAPLCVGCRHRKVEIKGAREKAHCAQGRDMDEATRRGNCPGYLAVPTTD